jgi:2-polyprenyl-3-methyl-5-hydroxy-6-metoxy-1,4-benzoquinol methylase
MTKGEYVRSERACLPPAAQLQLFRLPRRREFVARHVGAPPKRVLDAGCATGYMSLMLARLGHHVTGIELNPAMAAQARAQGLEVLEHDLERALPLPDECMDAAHVCEVIEHLFDTEGFLREVHRVLVPEGVLILSTPNLNSFGNRIRVACGLPLPMWGAFPEDTHGTHVRVLNKAKTVQLLERTGFSPTVIEGINQTRLGQALNRLPSWSEMLLVKAVRT